MRSAEGRNHRQKRRGPESNRRIAVLQTAALPLGYRATRRFKLFVHRGFLKPTLRGARLVCPPGVTSVPHAEGRRDSTGQTRGRLRLVWDVIFGALTATHAIIGTADTVLGDVDR